MSNYADNLKILNNEILDQQEVLKMNISGSLEIRDKLTLQNQQLNSILKTVSPSELSDRLQANRELTFYEDILLNSSLDKNTLDNFKKLKDKVSELKNELNKNLSSSVMKSYDVRHPFEIYV